MGEGVPLQYWILFIGLLLKAYIAYLILVLFALSRNDRIDLDVDLKSIDP